MPITRSENLKRKLASGFNTTEQIVSTIEFNTGDNLSLALRLTNIGEGGNAPQMGADGVERMIAVDAKIGEDSGGNDIIARFFNAPFSLENVNSSVSATRSDSEIAITFPFHQTMMSLIERVNQDRLSVELIYREYLSSDFNMIESEIHGRVSEFNITLTTLTLTIVPRYNFVRDFPFDRYNLTDYPNLLA